MQTKTLVQTELKPKKIEPEPVEKPIETRMSFYTDEMLNFVGVKEVPVIEDGKKTRKIKYELLPRDERKEAYEKFKKLAEKPPARLEFRKVHTRRGKRGDKERPLEYKGKKVSKKVVDTRKFESTIQKLKSGGSPANFIRSVEKLLGLSENQENNTLEGPVAKQFDKIEDGCQVNAKALDLLEKQGAKAKKEKAMAKACKTFLKDFEKIVESKKVRVMERDKFGNKIPVLKSMLLPKTKGGKVIRFGKNAEYIADSEKPVWRKGKIIDKEIQRRIYKTNDKGVFSCVDEPYKEVILDANGSPKLVKDKQGNLVPKIKNKKLNMPSGLQVRISGPMDEVQDITHSILKENIIERWKIGISRYAVDKNYRDSGAFCSDTVRVYMQPR